jgi:hypothetical protein
VSQITCSTHNVTTPETAICSHAFKAWQQGDRVQMVTQAAVETDPWPDAWCEACEARFQAMRDEQEDGFSNNGELVLLCTQCYGEARAAAERTGGLRVV